MAGYFPQGYQPFQYQQATPQAYNQPQNGVVWVQGVEGAKAYPVASGSSVMLMDSEENVFYIKTTVLYDFRPLIQRAENREKAGRSHRSIRALRVS